MHDCTFTIEPTRTTSADVIVALAGNPNCGKTTIFNALTGLRQKVGNYPGVTVERKTGRCRLSGGRWASIIDLPGTYSLISRAPDERIAMEVLRGLREDTPAPQVVIAVVDASNLQRNLYLVSQLIEVGRPLVIALNMLDIAQRRGIHVNAGALEKALGVPVVPVVGHRKQGIAELIAAIDRAAVAPMPAFPLPEAMRAEIEKLAPHAGRHAERLLIGDHAEDVQRLARRDDIAPIVSASMARLREQGIDPMQADIEAHYQWIDSITEQATHRGAGYQPVSDGLTAHATGSPLVYAPPKTLTERADAILIHKVWGLLIFAAIMGALFYSLFFIADPIMGWVEEGVAWLGGLVTEHLPEGPIRDLWADGIVAGVGAVVVFVPQIALLFLFLAVLEDSGYLARAAFLMDRLLRGVGLHGKSFIPLLSSFACAIPGIMATRTIEDRRDRLATIFVAPFMSCSARLPVYILLIGTFFAGLSAWGQAAIMLSLYVLGILAAAGTAWIFKRSLLKGQSSAFILELPVYKIPQISQIGRTVWTNSKAFIVRAGTIIFCLSVILWAMAYYPRLPEERIAQMEADIRAAPPIELTAPWITAPPPTDTAAMRAEILEENLRAYIPEAIASAQLEHSISGRLGHAMEPVIRPLGYDWKMGVGLVAAFAAREVFVSQMAIVYSAGDAEEDATDLQASMRADTYPDGRPVWTPAVAASLLVWFVLAMQCMSTVAIVRRETGTWRWPILMILYMNALAYVAALLTYQIGSRLV